MSRAAGFFLHLYQPPRENPWLGLVPNEWSAWPYHDWNERITAECYRALVAVALARNDDGATELFEPLASSGFDVGPTLHHWIERHAPDVDRAIDYEVRHVAAGVNSVAFAAPFVHAILPLATPEDRHRLVAWGIADFTARFNEPPLGMWLPETAVDLATLDALADHGIAHTVLMPVQAARVRSPDGQWHTVDAHSLDTSRCYIVRLSKNRTMNVVFGHRDLSQRVAFGDLIASGTELADVMVGALGTEEDGLVLLVADGETYGHHHRFGDLGLAWALRRLQRHHGLETAIGTWLETQEPTWEVELREVSSWSCAHGVERWRSDCGCTTGSQVGWHQSWRSPLREALNWLRERAGEVVDEALATYVRSVDETLLDYGQVLAGTIDPATFVASHARRRLETAEVSTVLALCEVHRNLLYSFTSCAWFFADPASIETGIALRYAATALDGASKVLGVDLESQFVEHLAGMDSNEAGLDASAIWKSATEIRFDEVVVGAGFALEHLAYPGARRRRGDWSFDVGRATSRAKKKVRVSVTHEPTLRTSVIETRVERVGPLGARVRARLEGSKKWRDVSLDRLGSDVVARCAASWIDEPGSDDFEEALNMLVADLLTRPGTDDDVTALLALAGASRCVSPVGEASIRRAVLAITGRDGVEGAVERLEELATSVGLGGLAGGGPSGADG